MCNQKAHYIYGNIYGNHICTVHKGFSTCMVASTLAGGRKQRVVLWCSDKAWQSNDRSMAAWMVYKQCHHDAIDRKTKNVYLSYMHFICAWMTMVCTCRLWCHWLVPTRSSSNTVGPSQVSACLCRVICNVYSAFGTSVGTSICEAGSTECACLLNNMIIWNIWASGEKKSEKQNNKEKGPSLGSYPIEGNKQLTTKALDGAQGA